MPHLLRHGASGFTGILDVELGTGVSACCSSRINFSRLRLVAGTELLNTKIEYNFRDGEYRDRNKLCSV